MEYRLYPLKDEKRLNEVRDLFALGLGETTIAYWKWKHFSPNGLPESMLLVAENDNGKIVGMYALQPTLYRCAEKQILIVQTEDLVIDPTARGTGLMKQLQDYMTRYYKNHDGYAWVAYANPISFVIFQKYGATNMGDIFSLNSRKTMLPPLFPVCQSKKKNWTFDVCDSMPEDVFCTEHTECFKMQKSPEFLQWKFDRDPDRDFKWLTIREDGALKGYIVFHVNKGRFRSAINIYDWDLEDCVTSEVLRWAVNVLRKLGNWVSLWGRYDEATCKLWMDAGLRHQGKQGTHFLLCAFDDRELPQNWHLTRADLDF